MGLFEQAFRETEVEPLTGVLLEIQQVLDRVRNPTDAMAADEGLAAIARLSRSADSAGEVYQKPWG